MEHVARLFIKNGAKDKFEERLLDIGTDGRYKAYSYSPNVLMFDRTDGYSVYLCRDDRIGCYYVKCLPQEGEELNDSTAMAMIHDFDMNYIQRYNELYKANVYIDIQKEE